MWAGRGVGSASPHVEEVECSNAGNCNYATGVCDCMAGFTGVACQRSMCTRVCFSLVFTPQRPVRSQVAYSLWALASGDAGSALVDATVCFIYHDCSM